MTARILDGKRIAETLLDELKGLERKTSPFVEQLPADARRDRMDARLAPAE